MTRDAGGGGTVLGYQLTLFGPRGADYARHITTGPPSFWMMRRLCNVLVDHYDPPQPWTL